MSEKFQPKGDRLFFTSTFLTLFLYALFIAALVFANIHEVRWSEFLQTWGRREIRSALYLTLLTSAVSSFFATLVALPIAYALSRLRFWGRSLVNAIYDIPIVLPPIVVGLSLLILFNKVKLFGAVSLENWLNDYGIEVTFSVVAIILAQFTVITAFSIRMIKGSFDQIDSRAEDVALTLGCNRWGAFWRVALPQAQSGVVAATVMSWAKAVGEFGPILIFAGATRGKTEVLSTSVFLELNTGNIAGAASVSLVVIAMSLIVISVVRMITKSEGAHL